MTTSFALRRPAPATDSAPRFADRLCHDAAADRAALVAGLRATPATIAPRYLYDPLGCALFGAIRELPEYGLARAEASIFDANREAIAHAIGPGRQWVDLGAGDCAKGEAWIDATRPSRYVAVDVAREAIEPALAGIALRHPALEVVGVVTDFAKGLDLERDLDSRPALFFYPGSSIGNFAPHEALAFLRGVRALAARRPGSALLIGVDTVKPRAVLEAAYDDALGVTAAFNRNVLVHVNRILGSDFDPRQFAHRARYVESAGRVELHLEALRDTTVHLDGTPRRFAAGERIHTDNSHKYAPAAFASLLHDAGFGSVRTWQDGAGAFAVYLAACR